MEPDQPEQTLAHWRAFWANAWLLGLAVVFSVLVALLSLTMPLFMLLVYDRVLTARSQETLWALVILAMTLVLATGLMDYARRRLLARFAGRFQETLEPLLIVSRAGPLLGRDSPATAELDALRSFAHSGGVLTLIDVIWIPLFAGTIFLISPELGALSVVGCSVIAISQGLGRWTADYRWKEASVANRASSSIAGVIKRWHRSLPGMTVGHTAKSRFLAARSRSRAAAIRASDLSVAFDSIGLTLRNICTLLGLAIGASLVMANQLTVGGLVACLVLMSRVFGPFSGFLQVIPGLREAAGNWQRLGEVLRKRTSGDELGLPEHDGTTALELRQVSVQGDLDGGAVLFGLDLLILKGRVTEIVGPSGSGKSLLAEVLALARPAMAGSVLVNGVRATMLSPEALGHAAALVPDLPRFFAGTLAENISGFKDCLSGPDVQEAARAAGMHLAVQSLPKGYATRIDEDGAPLPRGLREQAALARALFTRPRVLVVDEPSDTLRSVFEGEGATAISSFLQEGNSLIILSRCFFDLAARANQYLVSGGRLLARGTDGGELVAFQKSAALPGRMTQ